MKKTQMIHSPRTFKIGLGLMLAAGLVSMPVMTGASERTDKKTTAEMAEKARVNEKAANQKLAAVGKSVSDQPTTESIMRRLASAKSKAKTGSKDRSSQVKAEAEAEARKIAARLTPKQKTKLLSLLNKTRSSELTQIAGIGKSDSTAKTRARPSETIEDLRRAKADGLKSYAEVIDQAASLMRRSSNDESGTSRKGSPKSSEKRGSLKTNSKSEA